MGRITAIFSRMKSLENRDIEVFQAQAFLHLDAIYSDALCLTGHPEDAADLVEAAYVLAFKSYKEFGRRRVPAHMQARCMRAWLLEKMHAVFCKSVLALTELSEETTGER